MFSYSSVHMRNVFSLRNKNNKDLNQFDYKPKKNNELCSSFKSWLVVTAHTALKAYCTFPIICVLCSTALWVPTQILQNAFLDAMVLVMIVL